MRLGIFCALDQYPDAGLAAGHVLRHALQAARQAEALGLESFWVTEHHFSAYGACPDPAVLLARMAADTRRLRLGTATAVLPLEHPLRTAERYALLDQLCAGRLEFGVGSGYLAHEFSGFGLDATDKRARFDAALAVIRMAWSGAEIAFAGPGWQIQAPPLNVLPAQPGGPPIHVGLTRPQGAPFVGRQGLGLATVPYISLASLDELASMIAHYRAALPIGATGEVTVAVHAFCSESVAECTQARAALDRYLRTRVLPGANYTGRPIAGDFVLFGAPAEIAPRLQRFGRLGVDRLLLLTAFGALPPPLVAGSVARLAQVGEAALRRLP